MHHVHPTRPARLLGAAAVSLAGHALVLVVTASLLPCRGSDASVRRDYGVVAVVPVSGPRPEEPPEPELERPPERHVALPAPDREERPDEATFADRYDRSVERETMAREMGASASPRVVSADAATRGTPDAEADRTVAAAVPERRDGPRGPTPTEGPAPAGETSPLPTDVVPTDAPSEGAGVPDAPSPRGEGLDLTLFGANASEPIVLRGERTEVLELEEGDRTLVNSQQSLYWSFFERLRRQIQAEWDPLQVYRRNDPTGQLYRRLDRYTVLDVTLGSDGALRDAVVYRGSGLDFLDQEALRAMRAASPYPNVPEGLKDENGLVSIRFGFVLMFDGSTRLRRLPL